MYDLSVFASGAPSAFALVLLIFSVLLVFVAVRTVKSVWLAATLPAVLLIIASVLFTVYSFMGQPAQRYPTDTFTFLRYHLSDDKEWIYLWIVENNKDYPITISIPYTTEEHEKAAEAQEQEEGGGTMEGEMVTVTNSNGQEAKGFEYYQFQYEQINTPGK